MRVIVGAPVAHRDWALAAYFAHIASQTRRPDGFAFIHSGRPNDATWLALQRGCAQVGGIAATRHNPTPAHQRHDPERFQTLADLRNQLIDLALELDADVLVSLDTDLLLTNPRTIERLLALLDSGWDTASPVTWLHPFGEGSWAYNFGWWRNGQAGHPRRPWTRGNGDEIAWGKVLRIDVPMAAIAMSRRVLETCRYRWHEAGEDLGFAQDLHRRDYRCGVDTALKATHMWDESHLPDQLALPLTAT